MHTPLIHPVGDSAVLLAFDEQIDLQVNRAVHAVDRWINRHAFPGFIESIPAYSTLLVQYNPLEINYQQLVGWLQSAIANMETSCW